MSRLNFIKKGTILYIIEDSTLKGLNPYFFALSAACAAASLAIGTLNGEQDT